MKIILLGTGGYHPNDRRHTHSMLLPECGILLDAGTAMYRLGRYLQKPELDIFLTHVHMDHVVGLTYLLDTAQEYPLEKVRVHATPEYHDAIDKHLFAPAIFPKKPPYEACLLEEEVALTGGGRLTHFPLKHQGPSLGFRLDWPGHSMAYVTDTTTDPDEAYIERIAGVDLLLHECYFEDGKDDWAQRTGHSTTSPVAQIAKEANVGQLVLVHINPLRTENDPVGLAAAQSIFPNTLIGEDLMELEF